MLKQLNVSQINQLLESAKQLATLQEETPQDHTFVVQFLIIQAQHQLQRLNA
jgi:hypothetical protein